ncbi:MULTISPECIES: NADPH-dependent FMN reductase [unclassified Kitasatospora]|uniref:NADPH-dependent FMN reductase n=1 Tax=unclassified Kitasatospora TaxID=2633591 RepID=UPI003819C239
MVDWTAAPRPPLVIGIGGTGRPDSTTERALRLALDGAARAGAEVRMFGGEDLGRLPVFVPGRGEPTAATREFLDQVARADGFVLASPSYHGGVAALVKNALDHLEELRHDPRPYLDGRAVGCVVTAAGWQTGGGTLASLRATVHALRGWPTPLGITVNSAEQKLRDDGTEADRRCLEQLALVGRQVAEFALGRSFAPRAAAGAAR